MVVPGGVEDEVAEQFSGGLVDDPDVQVLDQQEDVGSGVGSSDADVVEAAVVAQGDDAGVVDAVAADPLVGGLQAGGGGFGSGGVGGRGCSAGEGAVRTPLVVVLAEGVELGLEFGQGAGSGSLGEPFLQGLVGLDPGSWTRGGITRRSPA